ncbi:hypothetical protein NW070_02470 [Mycoplasmopsis cynos]|nr:hypothetical protein [Mycoplasmopsis cynos]UWV77753.1 hypothetical protein NW070_02470 [Mycoplasmopsis cynos]
MEWFLVLINQRPKENLIQLEQKTSENWKSLFNSGRDLSLINTLILGIVVSGLVIILSLITVYAVYRQKNKLLKTTLTATSNIPLINPDNITAPT